MDIDKKYYEYLSDVDSITSWSENLYQEKFSNFFNKVRQLYGRFQSNSNPITDSELEELLTDLPLSLFSVSEDLNNFRTLHSIIKIKRKEKTINNKKSEDNDPVDLIEDEILLIGISNIISRVENEISFCKELIMGAKKVWDRRKSTEMSNPVGCINTEDLPEYSSKNTYIK